MIKERLSLSSGKAALLALALWAAAAAGAADSPPAGATAPQPVFATVGDTVITQDQYNAAFSLAARRKFYHGKPPEGAIALLQREVGDDLVTHVLLVREAKRRGLQPDQAELRKALDAFEQRYATNDAWKKNRAEMLPAVTEELEQGNLIKQLEQAVRSSVVPAPEQVGAYYAEHPEKFTEPDQLHVQVILLKVDPSSPTDVWEKTEQAAQDVVERLREGADFAELARQLSGDESAQQGGDLGYLHNGMMPEGVQTVLNGMKTGDLSAPVQTLQGFAVFRLVDRKPAKLIAFDAIRARAQEMLQREQRDMAWKSLIAGLKQELPARIDQSRYLPLLEPPGAQSAP